MAFTTGVLMLVAGIIVSGICRYVALIRMGKRQEEAAKKACKQDDAAKEKKLEEAEASLAERKAEKQHELYVRRMFREIS